jgi:hypothetical protein
MVLRYQKCAIESNSNATTAEPIVAPERFLLRCCIDVCGLVASDGQTIQNIRMMQEPKQAVIALLPLLPIAPGDYLPSGATEEQLISFQQRMGIIGPTQLLEWLSICNGPCVARGGVYGIRRDRQFLDIETRLASLPSWCGNNFIPVAGDGCGSEYVLSVTPVDGLHPVFFVDHEDDGVLEEPSYAVASSLWHFLRFLFREELGDEGWPFDSHKVLNEDAEILKVENRLLAWNR